MLPYDEYGNRENPTILLLHGAGVVDTFAQQYAFSQDFHLVVPHLFGAGKSVKEIYEPQRQKEALWELIASLGKEKIGLMGHSLGAQLAIMLACEKPECFSFGVFLSPWVNPEEKTQRLYLKLAPMTAEMLHWGWLVRLQGLYWHFNEKQTADLISCSKQITTEQYKAFFAHTIHLDDYPQYKNLQLPMLAICGSGEVKDMKRSLVLLAENPNCKTLILKGTSHDFPMRAAEKLNPVLLDFIRQQSFCLRER